MDMVRLIELVGWLIGWYRPNQVVVWLVDWSTHMLVGWLFHCKLDGWLASCLADWLVELLTGWLFIFGTLYFEIQMYHYVFV